MSTVGCVTRIALATCDALPDLDPEDAPLLAALADRGATAEAAVWDDPDVDWSLFDLVVIRSTWDYAQRRGKFLGWASRVGSVSRLVNPYAVVRWNSDKHYLRELESAGVRIVPTLWLEPERHLSSRALHTRFPADGEFVIKPAVSAGSLDTGRYTAIDATSRGQAIAHARRLLEADRTVMVQRYLTSVDTVGERAHVFIAGEYSHSVLKGAMLDGPDVGVEGVYKEERMSPAEASAEEIEVSRKVIDVARQLLTFGVEGSVDEDPFLYARVDLVSDDEGRPVLMELEMVEPSLFVSLADGALERFADAIVARATAR
jgi:glutathione synthase/RimK-type ligase-like ATP-grasp enzyme